MKFLIISLFSLFLFFQAAAIKDKLPGSDLSLATIKKNGELSVCSDAGFLPFEMIDKNGKWTGFDVDMMKAFSRSIGVKLRMVQISFDGIIPALIAGKCDLIAAGMTRTPERSKIVNFSETTFINGIDIALKNTPENRHYKTLKDLDKEGVILAVKTGYTSDIFLQKNIKKAKILRFDEDSNLILAVLQNRANAFVSDTTYVSLVTSEKQDSFLVLHTQAEKAYFSVAGRKQDTELMNKFNSFLEHWKKSGQYDEKIKFYFKNKLNL